MKDTKYEDLNKTLAAVGKAVFVNFYYDFKDFSISKDELAKKNSFGESWVEVR